MPESGLARSLAGAAAQILSSRDDWEKRDDGVHTIRQLFEQAEPGDVAVEALRPLREAFESTLKDLRSTLVRDSCAALAALAQTAQDTAAPLVRALLPVLIDQAGSPNKVIRGYAEECMMEVVRNVHSKHQIAALCNLSSTHKSKDSRDGVSCD